MSKTDVASLLVHPVYPFVTEPRRRQKVEEVADDMATDAEDIIVRANELSPKERVVAEKMATEKITQVVA